MPEWIPERGEEVVHFASHTRFKVAKRKRSRGEDSFILLTDENGQDYPLSECMAAADFDKPLNGDELADLLQIATTILEHRLDGEISLFSSLAPHHKRQFWLSLPDEVRLKLAELGKAQKVGGMR